MWCLTCYRDDFNNRRFEGIVTITSIVMLALWYLTNYASWRLPASWRLRGSWLLLGSWWFMIHDWRGSISWRLTGSISRGEPSKKWRNKNEHVLMYKRLMYKRLKGYVIGGGDIIISTPYMRFTLSDDRAHSCWDWALLKLEWVLQQCVWSPWRF